MPGPLIASLMSLMVAAGAGALAARLAVGRARLERELRRMEQVAEVTQRALLGSLPARVDRIALAYRYHAASVAEQVGGDFYDVAMSAAGARLIIGDVKGSGQAALGIEAAAVRAFREIVAERILFYTDGLIEARGADGSMLSLEGQVWTALTAPLLDDALGGLLHLVARHADGRISDDLAMVLMQPASMTGDRHPPAGSPAAVMADGTPA
jgi:serine phosphatase RsbU (regulator of sigma subunit)